MEIRHTWVLTHSRELVWKYLADSELLAKWLMPNDLQPIVGHQFKFSTQPIPPAQFDGNIFCEILEVQEFEKLSFSWKGGPGDGTISLDTVVTFTLSTVGSDTLLELVHSGFVEGKNDMAHMFMGMGWGGPIYNRLAEALQNAG